MSGYVCAFRNMKKVFEYYYRVVVKFLALHLNAGKANENKDKLK